MDEIEIVPPNSAWPEAFLREAARIRTLVPVRLILALEHIGSTAVPSLPAKPIIDILVLTPSFAEVRAHAIAPLEGDGYSWWRDNSDPARMFLVRGLPPSAPRRTHHLHFTEEPAVLARHLLFRDYLRAHPDESGRYGGLKQSLAAEHGEDREAYTKAKASYIESVVQLARQHAANS